jgi:hypothetical protein
MYTKPSQNRPVGICGWIVVPGNMNILGHNLYFPGTIMLVKCDLQWRAPMVSATLGRVQLWYW